MRISFTYEAKEYTITSEPKGIHDNIIKLNHVGKTQAIATAEKHISTPTTEIILWAKTILNKEK